VVVWLRDDIPPLLEKVTCCHELAHVLLRHLDIWNVTLPEFEADPDLAELGLTRSNQLHARYEWERSPGNVEPIIEEEAEALGIVLLACILRAEVAVPRLARAVYG